MPDQTTTHQSPATAGRVPIDFAAIIAAMQDQLDDLTSVVEGLERRLAQVESRRG